MMIRQGDILLVPASAPDGYIEAGRNPVLGLGEVTGHKHQLLDAVWLVSPEETKDTMRQFAIDGASKMPVFVVVPETGGTLTHEEHAPLAVPPGVWRVVRQREYAPGAIRSVVD